MKDLEGKVAFVTGGDSGIGLGVSRVLLRSGMKLVMTYRDPRHLRQATAELQHAGDRVHAIRLDVTDRNAFSAAADETIRVFGKVHILVNNAGVWPTIALSNASFDDFDWCMSVNVSGVFNGIRTFLPHIRSHGEGGHIVTTSSVTGLVVGPLSGVYSTSKFAVVGMMEALRSELEGSEVGVSVFCPGGVVSNIGRSDRNRPATFSQTGTPDDRQKELLEAYGRGMREAILKSGISQAMMSPLDAGEIVLNGIHNNDLYIISHAEYEQAIQERSDALKASIPDAQDVPPTRTAVARIAQTSMYANEIARRVRRKELRQMQDEPISIHGGS
jgi:NAD(P)-dependent dehydrogenase (short-subunit alcohol dehydrogenase family)